MPNRVSEICWASLTTITSFSCKVVRVSVFHGGDESSAGTCDSADYVITGSWGKKALKEAKRSGSAKVAATMADGGFTRVPADNELNLDPNAAYVHITTNETIEGVEWKHEPKVGDVPLVADASSDILSHAIPVEKYGLIYAGAQKNMGPSGVTLVILRDDLLKRIPEGLHTMLDYRTHVENKSLYNTPNTWGIYILSLVCKWVKDKGGLSAHAARERREGGTSLRCDRRDRLLSWTRRSRLALLDERHLSLPSEELEKKFTAEATAQGLGWIERTPFGRRSPRFYLQRLSARGCRGTGRVHERV